MEMRVGGRAGALVRAGVEKTTAIVGTLARDTAVTTSGAAGVAADGTRRTEVVAPLRGWVSAASLVAAAPRAAALEPSLAEYDELFSECGRHDSFCGFVCRYGCLVETRFPRRRGARVCLFIKVGLYDPSKQVCRLSRSAPGVISLILPPVNSLPCRLISGAPQAGRSLPRRRRAFRAPIDGACCPAIGAALGAAEHRNLSTR